MKRYSDTLKRFFDIVKVEDAEAVVAAHVELTGTTLSFAQ